MFNHKKWKEMEMIISSCNQFISHKWVEPPKFEDKNRQVNSTQSILCQTNLLWKLYHHNPYNGHIYWSYLTGNVHFVSQTSTGTQPSLYNSELTNKFFSLIYITSDVSFWITYFAAISLLIMITLIVRYLMLYTVKNSIQISLLTAPFNQSQTTKTLNQTHHAFLIN